MSRLATSFCFSSSSRQFSVLPSIWNCSGNNSYILRPIIGEGHNDSLHCVTDIVAMEKATGMMREEEKSSRDHLETVIDCMSLEEMEWSISIAEEEEVQECGDVIFLIVMVYSRASTSILALLQQVVFVVFFVLFCCKCTQVICHQQTSSSQ